MAMRYVLMIFPIKDLEKLFVIPLVAFLRRTPLSFRTKLVNGFRKKVTRTSNKKL